MLPPLTLPWPSRDLHPNSRGHWTKRSKAAKQARESAAWAAKAQWQWVSLPPGPLRLVVRFMTPDARRRDLDGCHSSIKAYLDGIADAMGFDDSRIVSTELTFAGQQRGGAVLIALESA